MKPEDKARQNIDNMLEKSGWTIQDYSELNLGAGRGVAVREYQVGKDAIDYALFIDRNPVGVVEAKPEGWTLTGVTTQSDEYIKGMTEKFPKTPIKPPFSYETTGIETLFADRRDPKHRSRHVFTFHRPEVLAEWLKDTIPIRGRLKQMPALDYEGLYKCQTDAIRNLERSFSESRQRALIQMATGSGKTFTAVTFIYRLIKFAKARRILFLVDRANLGRQALREFQQYATPDDGRKFTDLYNVQHLQSQTIDNVSVVISTVQRLYAILQGKKEFDEQGEEFSTFESYAGGEPMYVTYNENIPISKFDFIVIDECHRSIYNKWKQVLDYFDSFLIGLTATPSKHTIGFFNNNQVMTYAHERAVADGINVGYHVYQIRTRITEEGSTIPAGEMIEKRDRMTRKKRYETLDDDYTFAGTQVNSDVIVPDQIRRVLRTFRDKLPEIFLGRENVPKTLIFAKDDAHAEEITKITREVFGEGNEFCKKITYRTTGDKPENIIKSFRNSTNPRIAVTVDMIATGTDIKPLECIIFMRDVKSKLYFDQMKGRGTRTINPDDLRGVTPDAKSKNHFVIVDAVGVCEHAMADTHSLNRKKGVSFKKLMQDAAEGRADEDSLKSLAYRLSRLNNSIDDADKEEIEKVSGISISEMTNKILDGTDPDKHEELARKRFDTDSPTGDQIKEVARESVREACSIFDSPKLRTVILDIKKQNEVIVDTISEDEIIKEGFSTDRKGTDINPIDHFEKFIEENKDELTALSIIYSKPYNVRKITFRDIQELADAINRPPHNLTPDTLWQAYERLDKSRVKDNPKQQLTDLISIVRFATGQDKQLMSFSGLINEKFDKWLQTQESTGRQFTQEQREWLGMIKDHIASSISITVDDLQDPPFYQRGGLVRMHQVFGDDYEEVLEEMRVVLIDNR